MKDEVIAFIDLCAFIADVQGRLNVDERTRFIRADDSIRNFHMPLPVQVESMYSSELSPVSNIEFHQEDIELNKLAWQWHLKGDKRLYTVYCGKGEKSNAVVWSRPEWELRILIK
jgi:hypothetical protein